MKSKIQQIVDNLYEEYSIDGNGENHGYMYETVGVLVSCDDPLEMGRMQIFCPAYNDDPKKLDELPWVVYSSMYMGTIENSSFTRGNAEPSTTSGGVAYGVMGTPELGAHCLVSCLDGNPRRRVFKGCLPEHQNINTFGHGRYEWDASDGTPDGPFSSSGEPIQPLYNNYKDAFKDKKSAEWKTRGADFQAFSLRELPNANSPLRVDIPLSEAEKYEEDEWVKEVLGEHGYDWTGYKNLGSYLTNRVFGMSTPGFHSITMDDRHFNSKIRIRSTSGHQVILDDTNERIYVSTSNGKSWFEMDKNGHFDFYGKRISFHGEEDVNISSKRIRLKGENIFMYAGNETGQGGVQTEPTLGEIRIQSQSDTHNIVGGNQELLIKGNKKEQVIGDTSLFTETIKLYSNTSYELYSNSIDISNNTNQLVLRDEMEVVSLSSLLISSPSVNHESSNGIIVLNSQGVSISGNSVTFDNSTNDGLTLGAIVTRVNDLSAEHSLLPLVDDSSIPTISQSVTNLTLTPIESDADLAPWTNRVPDHEPWARVMKIDSSVAVNSVTDNHLHNTDWIDQFDNNSEKGRKDIGKVYGDEITERGKLWRR